ncbi:MAG: sulfatase [Cyclobacteriaceae bacterium]|nr:sulfatase [Cyclobacteriaceae bacterium]
MILIVAVMFSYCSPEKREMVEKPNILWITCEDISPYLGSYGFKEAQTPNLDKLATNGIRYTRTYANAPVCAVARSTILSGMYASTIGTHQMRSNIQLPEEIPAYPKILRNAGYYCTNNSKKDYNSIFKSDTSLWDASSKKAHYKNRKEGQPFFAVFNILVTHESQLSEKNVTNYINNGQIPEKTRIDPANIELPPYHPDLPEVRQDWARLHDLITLMDQNAGKLLDELKASDQAENTIVFFYSDHGGQLSRSKRFIYNVGTQVPLIVHLPKKWAHLSDKKPGNTEDELVSFVDLAKTVLSITGCEVPELMQGKIFLGDKKQEAPEYVHFFRDRMAERFDFSRAVTDGKYYFIRNFMPHRPLGRSARYGYTVQANWRAWEKHFESGNCDEIQSQFYQPRTAVELFNTQEDPWQVKNLSQDKQYQKNAEELSGELDRWMVETRDIGLIPEPMFSDLIGEGKKHKTIYEYAQSNDYAVQRILEAAKVSTSGKPGNIQECLQYIKDENQIIRHWGAYGLFLARSADESIQQGLREMAQNDEYASNRIIANQALGLCGNAELAYKNLMKECIEAKNGYIFLQGLNAIQYAHLDNRLSKEDWLNFRDQKFADVKDKDAFGEIYSKRIIEDALEIWSERRIVD